MRGYRFPSTETEHQTVISRFGGADFRSHPTKVSLTRSPDLQNLVCDRNDFLVKRTGWQVQQRYDAPVYGIFSASFISYGWNRPVTGPDSFTTSHTFWFTGS